MTEIDRDNIYSRQVIEVENLTRKLTEANEMLLKAVQAIGRLRKIHVRYFKKVPRFIKKGTRILRFKNRLFL